MNLTEFWAEGIKLNNEFQNNLISSSQQDMSNWNVEGEEGTITFSYEDAINTLTFENDGKKGVAQGVYNILKELNSGATVNMTFCEQIATIWSEHPDYKAVFVYLTPYLSIFTIIIAETLTFPSSTSSNRYYYTYTNGKMATIRTDGTSPSYDSSWKNASDYMINVQNYQSVNNMDVFPLLFNKDISLSVTNLESNCFYTVKFKACSPSGFAASDIDNIIITGDTTQSGKISNIAFNDLVEHKFVVFSEEGNINIKFDLKQIINTSTNVTLKISEIGIYSIDQYASITGNPINFTVTNAQAALKSNIFMNPIQSLNGYDYPWPAGGGKNKFDQDTVMPSLGFIQQSDGSWFANTPVGFQIVWTNTDEISGSFSLTYTYKFNSSTSQGVRFRFKYSDGTTVENYVVASESYRTVSFSSNASKTLLQIDTSYGTSTVQTWMKDIQIEIGTPTTFAPYSNICPSLVERA